MRNAFTRSLAVLALLIGAAAATRADVIVVDAMINFFDPSDVTIATGDTVCWDFVQGVHTTTSVDGLWDSDVVPPGTMFEYTFNQAGDYNYYCTLHLECCNMAGTVHVVDPVVLAGGLAGGDADPDAVGTADYEMRPYRSTLSVAVAGVTSTTAVDVFVNYNFLGTILLDDSGSGELDLNTDNGDTVPALQDGDEIEVLDASDDATIVVIGNVTAGG